MKDYWGVDDKTIVFVADPTFANIINFNVGQGIDLEVPTVRRGGGTPGGEVCSTEAARCIKAEGQACHDPLRMSIESMPMVLHTCLNRKRLICRASGAAWWASTATR